MTQLGLAPAPLPKPAPTAPPSLSALDSEAETSAKSSVAPKINPPSSILASTNERLPLIPAFSPGGKGSERVPAPFRDKLSAPSPSLAPTGGEGRKGERWQSALPAASHAVHALSGSADSAKSPPADVAVRPHCLSPMDALPAPLRHHPLWLNSPTPPPIALLHRLLTPNGTTVALNGQRMKFVAEKNETAGRTGQKVPHVASSDAAAAVSALSARQIGG